MENETGSREMLELVDRYSRVIESTPNFFDSTIPISESRLEGEVVVSHPLPHFSSPTDEY